MKTCPQCVEEFNPSSRHQLCPKCRMKNKMKFCPECDTKIHYNSVTCNEHKPKTEPLDPSQRKRRVTSRGYVYLSLPGKSNYAEHRYIMEQILGRELLPGENVHHKNGIRYDNRPKNLELWVTNQPCGQRVEDLLSWADEIISRYRLSSNKL